MNSLYCQDKESPIMPREMVKYLCESQGAKAEGLPLDPFCIITFLPDDHYSLVKRTGATPIDAWTKAFRNVCRGTVKGRPMVLANSPFGAANALMLLEELAAYGVFAGPGARLLRLPPGGHSYRRSDCANRCN